MKTKIQPILLKAWLDRILIGNSSLVGVEPTKDIEDFIKEVDYTDLVIRDDGNYVFKIFLKR